MNLIFAILGLIISIMSLNINKIRILFEFGLSAVIGTYTYKLFFGKYILWKDEDWIDENIYDFFSDGEFSRCLIAFIITWFFLNRAFPFIIKWVINKQKLIGMKKEELRESIPEAKKKKIVNNLINKVSKLENLRMFKNTETINSVYKEISKLLSYVIQLCLFWYIISGNFVLWEKIIFVLISIIIIVFIFAIKNSIAIANIIDEDNNKVSQKG